MRFTTTVAILLWAINVHAQIPVSPHFSLEKLAEGVQAAIAADTG
jgi:hypothetical protein